MTSFALYDKEYELYLLLPYSILSMESYQSAYRSSKAQKEKDNRKIIFNEEIKIGDEKLFKIPKKDMNNQLHKHIGALLFLHPGSTEIGKGTGVLISPNLVLTVAHNLYHRQTKEEFYGFKFYPKQSGQLEQYYEVESTFYPKQFKQYSSAIYDYALLKLTKKVNTDKFMPLIPFDGNIKKINNDKIAICGYPSTDNYEPITLSDIYVCQFGLKKTGCVLDFIEGQKALVHRISTLPGQSGAPIVLEDSRQNLAIIGIHKGGRRLEGDLRPSVNAGRIISLDLIAILRKEVDKMQALPFLTEHEMTLFYP